MNSVSRNNPLVKELLMLVPNLALLVGRMITDKRISTETKMTLGAAALYFVSPIDAVPDLIPFLGQLDDVIVVLLLVDGVVNQIDPEIVEEHWRGDLAMLRRIQSLSARLTGFIPSFIKEKFFSRVSGSRAARGMRFVHGRMNRSETSGTV